MMGKGGFTTYRGTRPRRGRGGIHVPRFYQRPSPDGRAFAEGHPLQRVVRVAVRAALEEAKALHERRRRNVAKLLGYTDVKWLKPGEAEALVEAFRLRGQPARFDD